VSLDQNELEKMMRNYVMFEHKLKTCSESDRAIIEVALIQLGAAIFKKTRDIDRHITGHKE